MAEVRARWHEQVRKPVTGGWFRARVAAVAAVLLVPLAAAGFGSAALAQESPAGCDGAALLAPDEVAALARAAECDAPVEIESARAFTERQVAQPDGTITLESYLRPRWAYDRAGNWVEADPTLVVDEAGAISTVATVVDVAVSSGGSGPLVTAADLSGASISLTWPETLPPPVLDGPTATYPEVFEDVDLQLTARTDSFSYALVVHTAAAATNPQLATVDVAIATDGLAISQKADGAVVATDANGEVAFSAAGAYMWDSSSPPPPVAPAGTSSLPGGDLPDADPGRVVDVDLTLAGDALQVAPDQAMLADPETEFPVTIDPTFTASRLAWATVGNGQYADTTWWNDGAWPRMEGLRIGFQGWTEPGSEGYGRWRSMARFDTETLRGSTINSASVGLTVFHTGGCESAPLELWQVQAITQGAVPTSWNSTSGRWLLGAPLETKSVPSANGTGDWCDPMPNRAVTFSGDAIRQRVQRHADVPYASISFGLRAGDEADMLQWMRAHTDSFKLVVNYTPVLAVPSGLTADGVGCLAPGGSRVVGSAPLLSGTPKFSEGTVRARVEVRVAGEPTALRSWQSEPVPSGEPVSWQVDAPLPDGGYEWRMRSEHPVGTPVGAWSGWCGFGADSALDVEPGPEAAADVECPVAAGEPLEAADESTALLLAQACDAPAEVLSERDFDVRVLAQPGGTLVAEQFTRPQWAWDGDGQWVGVDPSFAEGADGTISTVAAVSEIVVSGGGDGPLLTATDPDGGSVSLSWPEPLPAPVLEGATVTYPEVLADVDLQVAAGVDGFSYVLVVKSAAAAASPELASVSVGIDAGELDVVQDVDGGVAVQDAAGEVVFSAPAAYMWDSSTPAAEGGLVAVEEDGSGDPEDVPPGRFTEMPLEVAGDTLTVEPDQTLLSDPGVEFPVLIDPPFSGRRMHWASVHQQQAGRGWTDDSRWPREGAGGKPEMRIGRLGNWPNSQPCGYACGLWRSAIRFDIRGLSGKQIVSASVKAVQTHTSGCGSYGLQLWYVTAFTSGTSWNGLSNNWQDHLQSKSVASSNRTGGCGGTHAEGVTFGASAVRSRVQAHANAGHGSLSFGFRSSDESSIRPYRRVAVGGVRLEVEYNRLAQPPVGLSTDGRGCATSSPGPWLTTQRPTLSGKPRDPDGRTGAHLQVHRVGSSGAYYSWKSATNRKHNTVVNHRIPHGKRLPSGAYRWRMRSLDNHPSGTASSWVGWCYFRVDVTSPTTPTVELVGDPPTAGEDVTLRFRSSDAHSGLARFYYGINEEVKRKFKDSSGTTTITFTTPASGARNWIYVWSKDKAGNFSNRAVFDFFAARLVEATPVAAWRLDGDGLDDSGQGHELLLGNGVSWQDDGGPPADRSLGFDGTGCVATEGPVVRTDAEYTVAARVRLDDTTQDHTIMTSAGRVQSGFFFKYKAATGKWRFTLSSVDSREVSWATVETATAVAGRWTHLAVRVDPAARHLRMYVDGVLSGDKAIPFVPWHIDGALHLGCSSRVTGDTWDHFDGAIHHAGVWQGLLTPAQITAAFEGELAAGVTGDWRLRADGVDASAHARDLTLPASGVTWVDDQYGRQRSAMRLDGTAWAESAGPIVRTDRSFSVAAWVRLDDKGGQQTVVGQSGEERSAFKLGYSPSVDRWTLAMASHDTTTGYVWHIARSTTSPEAGKWYHLTGVFDNGTGTLRLYVDGELQGSAPGPTDPWRSGGPLLVGAIGDTTSGLMVEPLVGTVSDVRTWRGALTDEQAAAAFGGNPAVAQLSRWNLDGQGTDTVGGNHLTVEGVEGADYDWVEDRFCFPFRALGLQVSGGGFARTSGPVVVTDESFTITTWVKLDELTGGYQTVLAQRGAGRAAMYLQVTPAGAWRLSMPQQEFGTTTWAGAESAAGVAKAGAWTPLAGVFDLAAGEVRLFVGGERVAVGDAVDSPWHADGPFYIGNGGIQDGLPYQPTHASIDTVTAWSSTLDPDRIADLARRSPFEGPCP